MSPIRSRPTSPASPPRSVSVPVMISPQDLSTRSPGGDSSNPAERAGALPTTDPRYGVDDFGFDHATRLSFGTDSAADARFAANRAGEGSTQLFVGFGDDMIQLAIFFDQSVDGVARFQEASQRCDLRKVRNGR